MTKLKNWRLKIVIFLGLFILFIPSVRANPVLPPVYEPVFMAFYVIFLFIITFSIETAVIKLYLVKNKPILDSRRFYKAIFAVNIFTFPLTQMFAIILYQYFLNDYDIGNVIFISVLIEVFPITLECVLFLKIFQTWNDITYFEQRVRSNTILKSTITANLVSFGVGMLTYGFFTF